MSVAAPVRTLTPGHSISGAGSPATWVSALALDDVLKRSSADELKRLLDPEPQLASPTDRPNSAILPATRMFFPFSLAAFYSRAQTTESLWQSIDIVFETRVEQVILPDSVDTQIAAGVTLALEPGLCQQTDGGNVVRYASRFQPVQAQSGEAVRYQRPHG